MIDIHRVSLDFPDKESAIAFAKEFVEFFNLGTDTTLVHKDKHVHEYLVRKNYDGNGRPVI